MDLLYSRYSNPMEFMRPYIDSGRFGEFVEEIISAENQRRKEQEEKEDDEKLWIAYVYSRTDMSYPEWKKCVLTPVAPESDSAPRRRDEDMTSEDINRIMNHLFPA